jgi:hypothetical protein
MQQVQHRVSAWSLWIITGWQIHSEMQRAFQGEAGDLASLNLPGGMGAGSG